MKLYYSPGACSMAAHIGLLESGKPFEKVRVDLNTHTTETGEDFYAISPRGYVPAIETKDYGLITENPAVLLYVEDVSGNLRPGKSTYDLIQWLGFIGTEIHGAFYPLFARDDDNHQQQARANLAKKYALAERLMECREWLVGDTAGVADNYLFVTTLWAGKFGIALPTAIGAFRDRNLERPGVRQALQDEGIDPG